MTETNSKVKSILTFSKIEKRDLLISWITLSLAFAVVLMRIDFIGGLIGASGSFPIELALPISFIAVGTGFVFHELAHREAAKSYGFHSEYRAWYPMLGLAVIFAIFTGWILAAPGATYFFAQNVSKKQNGVISFAGPLINMIIGFATMIIGLIYGGLVGALLIPVAMINFWFAFFNLLPILMLDGAKVLTWKPLVWLIGIAIAGIMSFFPELLLALIGIIA